LYVQGWIRNVSNGVKMLSIVKNWLRPRANPIGVDFGSDSLKLAQVACSGGELRLIAAASADVPSHVRHDPAARATFFMQTIGDLLVQGKFAGRAAALALPAAFTFVQHLRMPKMDEDALKKAIPWEARGKLPIDPGHAVIRHHVAGEVYQDQEARSEVIVMAAGREVVSHLLGMASRAHLDVVGMNVEPKAIVDCFGHIYRRKADAELTNLIVDLGCAGSRVVIAQGGHILFARNIPIGGDHFTRAVATAMSISLDEAKVFRLRMASAPAPEAQSARVAAVEPAAEEGLAVLDAAVSAARQAEWDGQERRVIPDPAAVAPLTPAELSAVEQNRMAEKACQEPLNKLVAELDLCRRYYEATFASQPIDRLVFIGGEAKHRPLCQGIAQQLGLPAHVADPLARMGKTTEVGIESGIDPRQQQPNWTVAIGLSLGPPRGVRAGAEAA
jgi:type IV pilus assembly protein PilM